MSTVKQQATFKVLFFIKKKKLLKNGEAPICVRITVNKEFTEMMIKRSVPVRLWNQSKECSSGKDHTAMELNHYIDAVRAKIFMIQRQMESDGKFITSKAIVNTYNGRDECGKTLVDVYKEHNERCRALIGVDFVLSTVNKFDTSLLRLTEFLQFKFGVCDIPLSKLNGEFVREFEAFLKTHAGCHNNSAVKHLKNLKKIVRIAIANDWMHKDPFYGIQFRVEETNIDFLTKEELTIIMEKQFSIPRLEKVKDMFIFCCFTGLAFIDAKTLKPEHMVTDGNGALWIRKRREKTGVMCNIPVLQVAKLLLEKYEHHPICRSEGVMLPIPSNDKMNAYLEEIREICGIRKSLTTHVARHTCATTVMLANKVTLENVSKILGHSSTKMTERYAKVLDSSILRDMSNVEAQFAV